MQSTDSLGLIVLAPLFGSAGAMLFTSRRASTRLAPGVLLVSLLTALGLACAAGGIVLSGSGVETVVGGWPAELGIHLHLDTLSLVLLVTVLSVAVLLLLYAWGEGMYGSLFYGVFGIAVSGMAGVLLSADLFNLFVFVEVLSLSAAILIATKRNLPALYAAFQYLLVTVLSVTLYLTGVFLLYRECGELSFSAVGEALGSGTLSTESIRLAGGILFSGVAVRVALVPFHGWLPDAHSQAPHPISALLSGLMLKAGFIALWRVVELFPVEVPLPDVLRVLGLVSAVWGVLLALCQQDVKRLLAYHSVSQMGMIAAAAGAGAWLGAITHSVGHALFKSLLFLAVGQAVSRAGTRDLGRIAQNLRPARREVLPALCFLFGAAAIAGLPPFTGYVSKELISRSVKGTFDAWILKGVAVGTAASFCKLGFLAMFPAAGFGRKVVEISAQAETPRKVPPACLFSMIFLSLGVLLPGVFAERLLPLLNAERGSTSVSGLFTFSSVTESLGVLAGGYVVYLLIRSRFLKQGLSRIASIRPGLDPVLASAAVGSVLICLVAMGFF